jgi:hypothetical protein
MSCRHGAGPVSVDAGMCDSVPFGADLGRPVPVLVPVLVTVTVLVPAPGVGNGADQCRNR